MNNEFLKIGRFGRRTIFGGVGMAFMCLVLYNGENLAHLVGEKLLPYVILGIILIMILVLDGFLLPRCPEKLVIPIGIAGWIVTFVFLYLFFYAGLIGIALFLQFEKNELPYANRQRSNP